MKKLTTVSVIGLAVIFFSLLSISYYVKKNYVPPPPTSSLTDSLSLASDSLRLSTDSTFANISGNTDSAARHRIIDSAAIAQNMVVTNVLSDSLAQLAANTTSGVTEILPTAKSTAATETKVKEITVEPSPKPKSEPIPQSANFVTAKGVESGNFYVVVGTFTQEVNAKDEMKHSNKSDYSIIKDGQYFRLVAGEFSTSKSAKQRSNELTKEGISNFVIHR